MICQIQAAVPAVRPRKGRAILNSIHAPCLNVAQRRSPLDTDCLSARVTSALALALNTACSGGSGSGAGLKVTAPIMPNVEVGSTNHCESVQTEGSSPGKTYWE
ncbi:hypothetical protein D3C73_1250280 [compost metagenome]